MSSLGVHAAVTLFILAAWPWWGGKEKLKYIPLMMLFGIISDMDVFIGIHRATLHNIFIAALPLILIGLGRIFKIEKIEKRKMYLLLAFILLLLHILLDMSCGGVAPFHPASDKNISFDTALVLTREEIWPPQPESINQTAENVTETADIAGNITGLAPDSETTTPGPPAAQDGQESVPAPAPTPDSTPTPKISYGLDVEFESEKREADNVSYITIPSKEYPIARIINNGVELMFLITSATICFVRYFGPEPKK